MIDAFEWERALAFTATAAALVASPGPDSMLILRNTLAFGRASGWRTLAGVQVGVATHAALAVAGVSAVLRASEGAFRVLALAGGIYLAWLGLSAIRAPALSFSRAGAKRGRMFMQGMFCNLLNPKVLIIFIALIPGFVNPDSETPEAQIILLAAILLGLNIPFQSLLVTLAARADKWLSRPEISRRTQWLLGGALIFFGAGIVVEHALSR